jgi:hypothetical protein
MYTHDCQNKALRRYFMFASIGQGVSYTIGFCSSALSHPTFLGRAISWGIFHATLYKLICLVSKAVNPILTKIPYVRDIPCVREEGKHEFPKLHNLRRTRPLEPGDLEGMPKPKTGETTPPNDQETNES